MPTTIFSFQSSTKHVTICGTRITKLHRRQNCIILELHISRRTACRKDSVISHHTTSNTAAVRWLVNSFTYTYLSCFWTAFIGTGEHVQSVAFNRKWTLIDIDLLQIDIDAARASTKTKPIIRMVKTGNSSLVRLHNIVHTPPLRSS